MLRISRESGPDHEGQHLRLVGQLMGPWVDELRRICGTTSRPDTDAHAALTLDLADVSFVDADGVALLRELLGRHASLTKCSLFVSEQIKGMSHADSEQASTMPVTAGALNGPTRPAHGWTSADSIDEGALLAALRTGDELAFETMVRTYGGRLLVVARRLTRNEEDARDVVQSAYLSAFRAIGEFEGACQLSTWLHRIVVNTALMRLRTRRRKPEESIEELLPSFQLDGHHVEQFSDWCEPADQLLEQRETRATVRACIDQLPDSYRQVLLLRDIEELSTQEVAELLSLTQTAVKVRLHRARQALSTLLRRVYARPATAS